MKNKKLDRPMQLIILLIVIISITGCAKREQIVYFQGDQTTFEKIVDYVPVIQVDDQLVITISGTEFETTKPFNQINYFYQNQDVSRRQIYIIDKNGEIDYPILGEIKLEGLTRIEAAALMKEKLKEYIIDPGVNIYISNFKITVLGEVLRPGTFDITNERITILEALGLAGDLTINGVRENVMVVRETAGDKEIYRVNLTSNEIFNSPVYYLKQNDVVYVEPNKAQISSSTYNRNLPIFVSVIGLVITVISVLTR